MPWVDKDDAAPDSAKPADPQLVSSAIAVAVTALQYLSDQIADRLSTLRYDLGKPEDVSFKEELLAAILRSSLAAATGGISERFALALTKAGVVKEVLKSAIRSGINDGVALGLKSLKGSPKEDALQAFIDAQKEGMRRSYFIAEREWILTGRTYLQNEESARRLIEATQEVNLKEAVELHYRETRDGWISYLARSRFGAIHSKAINEDGALVETGMTTDLTSSENREQANRLTPGAYKDERGPSAAAYALGTNDGVLVARVQLPDIQPVSQTSLHGMLGRPKIIRATLNGVNDTIRDQYAGMRLADMRIPRTLLCSVDGGHDDFTVSVNENGQPFGANESSWLRARATASHPENIGKGRNQRAEIGLAMLLQDLVPTKIHQ